MKPFLLAILCAATLLGGCAQKPLTDSEFRGFCYTSIGRKVSCDTLTICNDYDANVMSMQFPSRQACAAACAEVYNRLYGPNQFEGCAPTVLTAYNWCMKYCNTNYTQ